MSRVTSEVRAGGRGVGPKSLNDELLVRRVELLNEMNPPCWYEAQSTRYPLLSSWGEVGCLNTEVDATSHAKYRFHTGNGKLTRFEQNIEGK